MARCNKCGRDIPDNMSYCGFCGASVQQANSYSGQASSQQYYGNSYGQSTNSYGGISSPSSKQKKKKGAVVVRLLVSLVVFIVGSLVCTFLINTLVGPPKPSADSDVNAVVTNQQERTVNPEYERIFSERYIIEPIDVFFGLDYKVYAKVLDGDAVEKLALAYEGDIVKEMSNVVYLPVSGYTEEQKAVVEQEVRKEYAVLDVEEFCTITYTMGSSYLIVDIECKDLDVKSNLEVLSDFGMVGISNADRISMKSTESGLIANGYAVKYFD